MSSDWEEDDACIRCNGVTESEKNKMLFCCGDDCKIALHALCMPVPPQFDVHGNFYCPPCAYKVMTKCLKKEDRLLDKAALKLADWIKMGSQGEGNGGVSARKNVEDVRGGEEREEESEPLVVEPLVSVRLSDLQEESSRHGVLGKRVAEEKGDNGTRKLPKSFSTCFEYPGRRKVFWTKEEEQALREGVRAFFTEGRRSIPWERILLAYKSKFNSVRTAANLKDKWTRMTKAYFAQQEGSSNHGL